MSELPNGWNFRSIHRYEQSLPDRDIWGKDRLHPPRVRWGWNDEVLPSLQNISLTTLYRLLGNVQRDIWDEVEDG
jgi:hypothetical protein